MGAVVTNVFAAKGCNIVINYASREDPAVELQDKLVKEFRVQSCVIKGWIDPWVLSPFSVIKG